MQLRVHAGALGAALRYSQSSASGQCRVYVDHGLRRANVQQLGGFELLQRYVCFHAGTLSPLLGTGLLVSVEMGCN